MKKLEKRLNKTSKKVLKLLLVEDDLVLANGLEEALKQERFLVSSVHSGKDALQQYTSFEPNLVVLDLGLPDIDGTEVLKEMRNLNHIASILILTARNVLDDKVITLDLGAYDYLAKPFDMPELLARLRVMSRRFESATNSKIILGTVVLDTNSHKVTVDGQSISLGRREYTMLKTLVENAGKVQTKNMLERQLYGWDGKVGSNTIEVHISHLRKKLPDNFIKTLRGIGYIINEPLLE